ncbi:hypothetical protein LTS18_011693, partial [Coniosporium uncinatum]
SSYLRDQLSTPPVTPSRFTDDLMAPGIMCFGRKAEDPDARKNDEIERMLRMERKKQEREVKLLLLGTHNKPNAWNHADRKAGAGESGKSTVLKQMRVIHAGGFSRHERKQWRIVIFNNLVNAFQIVLGAMEEQDTDFEDEDNIRWAELLASDPDIGTEEAMPLDCLQAFNSLWADKGVQLAILKGNEYALHDNMS